MAAVTLAVHTIVKEAVDAGVGLYSLYKDNAEDGLQAFTNSLQQGAPHLQVEAAQVQQDSRDLRGAMKAAGQAIEKVIDNQASLLALVSQGGPLSTHRSARICSMGPDALQLEINKGFQAVMQSVQDETAIRAAQEFKTKSDMAMLACNRMVDQIVAAIDNRSRQLTPSVMRDIDTAERSAAELRIWANLFVPSNPGAMIKQQSKLQTMPYIVAMAYAARVQAIAHLVRRDAMEHERDKITCHNRAHSVVDDFMAVLERALEGIMADTSLLDVATVYQLPMAMIMTYMTSFRASMDELLQSPGVQGKEVVVWNDGLAPIRNVLHCKASDADDNQEHTIELKTIADSVWWLKFTDTNLESLDVCTQRTSIHLRELCHVLGAASHKQPAHIALSPDHENALLQLPPASALRAALCATIAHARHAAHADRPAPPPSPPPPTFANIHAQPLAAAAPRTLTGHTRWVFGVAVCPDGQRVVSGSCDGTARVWSLSSGQHLQTFSGHTDQVFCVALSSDGKRAVSGSADKSVRVWSVDSGSNAQHTVLQGHSAEVWAVALSPDGRSIASGSFDKTVRLWNADTGQGQATLTGHSDWVYCVTFSPDGAMLVSGSKDKSIRVWNARTGVLQRTLHGHSGTVRGVAVTPDGQWLVSGSHDKTVRVWKLSSGAEAMSLEGHTAFVNCVVVFPDGQRIVSGSDDRSVRVWNVRSKVLELTLTGHSDDVQSVVVSPDGRSVVSGSPDTTIKVWDLSGGGLG